MKKTYVAPQMEQVTMKDMLPLCASGDAIKSGGGVVEDVLFGGKDSGGSLDPAIKGMPGFDDDLNGLLF